MNLRATKSKFRVAKVDMQKKGWGSFTDENVLLMHSSDTMKDYDDLTYLARKATTAFNRSLSKMKTPFNDYLKGKGAVHETENNFVRWRTYGDPDDRHVFLEDVTGTDYPGLGNTPFQVKISFDGYLPGAIIAPLLDKSIKFRVKEHATQMGGGYVYVVELVSDDPKSYVPKALIAEGTFVQTFGSAYGEASKDLSNLEFGKDLAYTEFEVPLITGRWKYEVTDRAHMRWGNLQIGEVSTSANGIEKWIKGRSKLSGWLEAQAFAQINWQKELWDTYGNASEQLIDRSSAKELTTSPGMYEFLEQGNVFTYSITNGSIDNFVNRIESVWFDRVEKSNQSIVFFTGKGGIKLFHDWVVEKYGQEAVMGTYDFVLGSSKSFHNDPSVKGYSFNSYQFTQYNIQPWGIISIAYWPMLDNTKINLVKAPNGVYPASSYEFFAFNVQLGEPNVRMLNRKNSEHAGYVVGHWTPLGPAGPNNPMKPSHTGLFYEWGYGKSWGLQIEDVHATMWFKPNLVY